MSSVVSLHQAGRSFGKLEALKPLTLSVEPGEVLGLLGHNGAGKSTMMKLVLGVLAPSFGSVRVLGEDPRGAHAHTLRTRLGYLPENVSFYDNLNGREVLHYFARLKRIDRRQADQLLERVGLAHAADRRVRTYSKGMRQRLGLAQALLGEPRLLVLDEPTVGLDPMAVLDVYGMIDELRGKGTSVILCSHVLPGVEPYIDRVAILCQGQLLATGTIDELRQQAGLPLRIEARGEELDARLGHQLAEIAVQLVSHDRQQLLLESPPASKLDALRLLLQQPGISDINVQAPALDALYAHFDTVGRSAEAH